MDKEWYLFLIVVSLLLIFGFNMPEPETDKVEIEISRVIDGDTVVSAADESIRLSGIDATETYEECSAEATEKLKEMIDDTKVLLDDKGEDFYGRKLGYIFKGDKNINKYLVETGLAYTYYFDEDSKYTDRLIEAERQAIKEGHSCLWSKDISYDEDVVDACNSEDYINKIMLVEGQIEEVSIKEDRTYLNFEDEYPDNCFTGIIWEQYYDRFDADLKEYEGNEIRVEGLITYYEGPQIELRDQLQIHDI